MEHCMLDLETLGTSPNAVILSIGAVEFDPTLHVIGERYYTVIDRQSAIDSGGEVDQDTVDWWAKQKAEAQVVLKAEGYPIKDVLEHFATWLSTRCEKKHLKIWGNGAAFDNAMLAQSYRRLGVKLPWYYTNDRCYRTLRALVPSIKMERIGTYHNAVDDAESQARHLVNILKAI